MESRGRRWLWPATAALFSLGIGELSAWPLLQHAGEVLAAVVLLSAVLTLITAMTMTIQGEALEPAVTAGDAVGTAPVSVAALSP